MDTTTALVIVIFGLLALNGAALAVAFLVFRLLLERFDSYIQQRTIESSVDTDTNVGIPTKPKKVFVRAASSGTTPQLVKSGDEKDAPDPDLVIHKDMTQDSRFMDLDQVDRDTLNTAYDVYRGFNPPAEAEKTETVEAK